MSWSDKFGEITEQDLLLIKTIPCVLKDDELYFRINPEDIDLEKMTPVKKGTDIIAFQLQQSGLKITTKHNNADYQATQVTQVGDYLVFNIGASDEEKLFDKLLDCDRKILPKDKFEHLYSVEGQGIEEVTSIEMEMLLKSLMADDLANPNFNMSFFRDPKRHTYIGKLVCAGTVNFNFVLNAPWGDDQYIKKGGVIIYNPNSSKNQAKDIYAIGGVRAGKPGNFEKTYKLAAGEGEARGLISDTFKNVIKCDRSPISGIQYSNVQVAEAMDKIGKAVPKALEKYLNPEKAHDPKNKPKHKKSHAEKHQDRKQEVSQDKGFST